MFVFFAVPQMQQFPPGFQGTALPQFGNSANFASFRPQFSVPGQSTATNFSSTQVIKLIIC